MLGPCTAVTGMPGTVRGVPWVQRYGPSGPPEALLPGVPPPPTLYYTLFRSVPFRTLFRSVHCSVPFRTLFRSVHCAVQYTVPSGTRVTEFRQVKE